MKEIAYVAVVALLSLLLSSAVYTLSNIEMRILKQQETVYLEQVGLNPRDSSDSLAERN